MRSLISFYDKNRLPKIESLFAKGLRASDNPPPSDFYQPIFFVSLCALIKFEIF